MNSPLPLLPLPAEISYEQYLDKVYGCWLGKSLGGTLGGPYEGRKELFSYDFDRSAVDVVLPNDDLDLQVLWLHVLEQKGLHLTAEDMAEAFAALVPYAPGEYAIFKKNYARGLYPPLTGAFNNPYYMNGMGCPIRSEVWACICPGNPAQAAAYAALDGSLDHRGDSIRAEQYLCAVEASAFLRSDFDALLTECLPWLGEGTRIRRLAEDTLAWCGQTEDWRKVWRRIVRDYGHPDCTNLYQNIAFTLLCLKHGQGDFIRTTMIAVNCGFDADCSCATAGAILGLIEGRSGLAEKYGFTDPRYVLSVPLERRSDSLADLAEDTCRVGVFATAAFTPEVTITGAPDLTALPVATVPPLSVDVSYDKDPVVGWGESKRLEIRVSAREAAFHGLVTLDLPPGWESDWHAMELSVAPGGEAVLPLTVTVPTSVTLFPETNLLEMHFEGGGSSHRHRFGLIGAAVWKVWGPFWKNFTDLPHEALGKSYFDQFPPGPPDDTGTLIRNYHLSTVADPQPAGFPEPDGNVTDPAALRLNVPDFVLSQTSEDRFTVGELIGFQGPCTVYAERLLHSPQERTVHLQVAHTDPFCLWLNGERLVSSDDAAWWTGENFHRRGVTLRAGENHLLLRLTRRSTEAAYGVVFTERGTCTNHITDLGSLTPFAEASSHRWRPAPAPMQG